MDLPEEIKVERRHSIIVGDPGEAVHQDELTVSLASVARFLVIERLLFGATFDNDDGRGATTSDS